MVKQLFIFSLAYLFSCFSYAQSSCDDKYISKLDKKFSKAEKRGKPLDIKYANDAFNVAEFYREKNDSNNHKWYRRTIVTIQADLSCKMPSGIRYLKQAGISMYFLGEYNRSESYLLKSSYASEDPESTYFLGLCLMRLKKYEGAITELNNFKKISVEKKDADKLIQKCKNQIPCYIKGFVFSEAIGIYGPRPVSNAKVRLVSSNGQLQEGTTDLDGNYFIKTFKGAGTITLTTETGPLTQAGKKNEHFISTKDQFVFDLNRKDSIKQDFFVKPMPICRGFPNIEFIFNSVDTATLTSFDNQQEDGKAAISILKDIMIDNPNIIVEISGHCDIRENKVLGKLRADYVVNSLVKNGISTKRLVSIGYGNSQPLVTEKEIKTAKSKEEKEIMYQKNRRAVFKILSFDSKE